MNGIERRVADSKWPMASGSKRAIRHRPLAILPGLLAMTYSPRGLRPKYHQRWRA
jgi:hypothetical protein